ncbi:MAG: hypothetical protein K9G61_10210 [Bacteroidales bacterium]|nr:hypothetical protein [Bacteroidales bacterium]
MKMILAKLLLITVLIAGSQQLISQPPPPPPSGHGDDGNQNAGNAPIDGGLGILLVLGAAYGGKRLYDLRKEQLEE